MNTSELPIARVVTSDEMIENNHAIPMELCINNMAEEHINYELLYNIPNNSSFVRNNINIQKLSRSLFIIFCIFLLIYIVFKSHLVK